MVETPSAAITARWLSRGFVPKPSRKLGKEQESGAVL